MEICRLPVRRDNYIFLLYDAQSRRAAVVDPADAPPVLTQLSQWQAELTDILITHHHGDHIGGISELKHVFPAARVYGGAGDRGRIPEQEVFLEDGDRLTVLRQPAEVLFVPGHTSAHIAYWFTKTADLFCGDTLFAGGCGRLFEGTPAQMLQSLDRLRNLPPETQVWCAHEYTLSNLTFALTVEPTNPALLERYTSVQRCREQGIPTIPTTIAQELATNPFCRWEQPSLHQATGYDEPVRVFAKLRGMKDVF
ncbi:MAG: hydroxyacylglutathione hydrolase [Oscillatoriales cyanobacterium SM2_2_1]|nr:hydroxyacylglutathione hydrolase [Oscillatoriales cyanobacterium SM2_2_1]